jgi:hypothetical protein
MRVSGDELARAMSQTLTYETTTQFQSLGRASSSAIKL